MRKCNKIKAKYGLKLPKLYYGAEFPIGNSPFTNTTMSKNITGGDSGAGTVPMDNTMRYGTAQGIGLAANAIGTGMSGFTQDVKTGKQKVGLSAVSQGLQMGGTGAMTGAMIGGPVGAAIGGGAGFIAGSVMGGLNAKKTNKNIDETTADYKKASDEADAEQERIRNNAVLSNYDSHGLTTMYGKYGGRIGLRVTKGLPYKAKGGELVDSPVGKDIFDDITTNNPTVKESTIRGIFDSETGNRHINSADGKYIGRGQISTANLKARGISKEQWGNDSVTANESIKLYSEYLAKTNGDEKEALRLYQGARKDSPKGMAILQKKIDLIDKYRKPPAFIEKEVQESYDKTSPYTMFKNKISTFGKLANGGKLPNGIKVNNADKLSSSAVVVDGKTHAEGGEIVTNNQSPVAEVEDQEVVRQANDGGTQVYSDELGYAQMAQQIEEKKGYLEQQVGAITGMVNKLTTTINKETDVFKKNGVKRKLDGLKQQAATYTDAIVQLNQQAEQLFQQQEAMKQQQGIENQSVNEEQIQGKYGMKIPKMGDGDYIPTSRKPRIIGDNMFGTRNIEETMDSSILDPDSLEYNQYSVAPTFKERMTSGVDTISNKYNAFKNRSKGDTTNNQRTPMNRDNINEALVGASLLADNVANAGFAASMPVPEYIEQKKYNNVVMNTTHDIDPELKKIDDTRRRYSRMFNISSPNSTYAAAKTSMVEDKLQESTGKALTNKQNIETERKNKMNLINAQVDQANIDMGNVSKADYINKKADFKRMKLGLASQNVTNAAGDITHMIERDAKRRYEKDYLDMLGRANPVFASDYGDKLITGLTSEEDAKALYNRILETHPNDSAIHRDYKDRIKKRFPTLKL